jgi:hypothetical protein
VWVHSCAREWFKKGSAEQVSKQVRATIAENQCSLRACTGRICACPEVESITSALGMPASRLSIACEPVMRRKLCSKPHSPG